VSVIAQLFKVMTKSLLYKYVIRTKETHFKQAIMTNNDQLNYSLDKNEIRIDYTTLSPRFSVTNNDSINDGITYLNEHGYAVFSDVMPEDEINFNKELLWKFLETIPGHHIQRNDPTTWSKNW
jgi:hypothetical protein